MTGMQAGEILERVGARIDQPLVPRAVHVREISQAVADSAPSREPERAMAALLLLYNDDLEESHTLSQGIPSATGSYLHGIMHRREPDYPNAGYWFRKVGEHPLFPAVFDRAQSTVDFSASPDGAAVRDELLRNGVWDPYWFIGRCEHAGQNDRAVLEAIQRAELDTLAAALMVALD